MRSQIKEVLHSTIHTFSVQSTIPERTIEAVSRSVFKGPILGVGGQVEKPLEIIKSGLSKNGNNKSRWGR